MSCCSSLKGRGSRASAGAIAIASVLWQAEGQAAGQIKEHCFSALHCSLAKKAVTTFIYV